MRLVRRYKTYYSLKNNLLYLFNLLKDDSLSRQPINLYENFYFLRLTTSKDSSCLKEDEGIDLSLAH